MQRSSRQHRSCILPASAAAVFAGVVVCIALCSTPVVNAASTDDKFTLADTSVYALNITANVAQFMVEKKDAMGYEREKKPLVFIALIPPGASDSDSKCDYPGRLKKFSEGAMEVRSFADSAVLQLVDEKTATGTQLESQSLLFEDVFQNMTIPSFEKMGCMGLIATNLDWTFSDTHARIPMNVTDKETGETSVQMRIEKVRTNPEAFWAVDQKDAFDADMLFDMLRTRSIYRGAELGSAPEVAKFVDMSHQQAASAVVVYLNLTSVAEELQKVKSVTEAPLDIQLQVFLSTIAAALSNLPNFQFFYEFAVADVSASPAPLKGDGSIVVYRPVVKGTFLISISFL